MTLSKHGTPARRRGLRYGHVFRGLALDIDQVASATPAMVNTIAPHASGGITSLRNTPESTAATGGMKKNNDAIFDACPARTSASSKVIAISELPTTRYPSAAINVPVHCTSASSSSSANGAQNTRPIE